MSELPVISSCRLPDRTKLQEVASLFKVLSDVTRLQIFMYLAESRDKRCVCDIWRMFPVGQPTISHHLKVLKTLKLIEGTRRGTWVDYRVTPKGMEVYDKISTLI